MELLHVQDLLALLSGALVGFSLGLIGGGGSILAVPLLLYVVGFDDTHRARQHIRAALQARVIAHCHASGSTELNEKPDASTADLVRMWGAREIAV